MSPTSIYHIIYKMHQILELLLYYVEKNGFQTGVCKAQFYFYLNKIIISMVRLPINLNAKPKDKNFIIDLSLKTQKTKIFKCFLINIR